MEVCVFVTLKSTIEINAMLMSYSTAEAALRWISAYDEILEASIFRNFSKITLLLLLLLPAGGSQARPAAAV